VSDQGEPDSVLRSQLHLVYQLILLIFGPTNLHQRKRTLDKFKKAIQKLVDTTFHLLLTNQSILVQVEE
jgi:Sec-independent protein translocase protein TatA